MKKCSVRIESILWNISAFIVSALMITVGIYALCYVVGVPITQPFFIVFVGSVAFWSVYQFLVKIGSFEIVVELETDERIIREQKIIVHYFLRYLSIGLAVAAMTLVAWWIYAQIISHSMLSILGFDHV